MHKQILVELMCHNKLPYIEKYMYTYRLHCSQEHIQHYFDKLMVLNNIDLNFHIVFRMNIDYMYKYMK